MDSDRLVKHSVAKCVGSVFEFLGISEEDWVFFLESLSAKYKIEVDKLYILEVLIRLRGNQVYSKKKNAVLEVLIKQTSENLGSTNYELNAKTITAIHKMLSLVWEQVNKKTVTELM